MYEGYYLRPETPRSPSKPLEVLGRHHPGDSLRRQPAKLFVNQRQELLRGLGVAFLDGRQDLRYVAHGGVSDGRIIAAVVGWCRSHLCQQIERVLLSAVQIASSPAQGPQKPSAPIGREEGQLLLD